MNYDLITELFYSCECLKLLNCIESKDTLILLAKHLFPEEVVKKISASENISMEKEVIRHVNVNRITGDINY